MNLGLLYEDEDDFASAQQCYKRVLEAFPDHPRARLFLKDSSASGDLKLDEQELSTATGSTRSWPCRSPTSNSPCAAATACRRWAS